LGGGTGTGGTTKQTQEAAAASLVVGWVLKAFLQKKSELERPRWTTRF
jgi:hypothetical protein